MASLHKSCEVSQSDTRPEDTCVWMTQGDTQLATLRARKVFDEAVSSSTEIDQPLYCFFNSVTDKPLPRTIVPTRWTPPSRVAPCNSSNARLRSFTESPLNASGVQTTAPS